MVAATPLTAERVPDRLSACNDRAGLPGYCCVPGCGFPSRTQLCARCYHVFADAAGTLPAWLVALRREATRLAVREHRARQQGVTFLSYDAVGGPVAVPPVAEAGACGRVLDERGRFQSRLPVAPQVTEVVRGPDALAALRRYSPSGVPLDMPAFLALLGDLCAWPPPGTLVDQRHREALIDLYERVYEPVYYESGTVARRLGISPTRLYEIGEKLGVPAARTDGGRRLYTEDEIARLAAWRADRPLRKGVRGMSGALTLRERAALYVRYGLDRGRGARTLKVTGQHLGVSGPRARQILLGACEKLGIDGSLGSVTPDMVGDHDELYRYLRWDVTAGPAGAERPPRKGV